ncbi:MAG: ankyrin repeat domain-containing protein, partial [Planctomycetota bacterium]
MLLGILLHAMMSLATDSPIAGTVDVSTNPGVYEYVTSAIHGFRMPLFYLVSGFFTAMLWQRRGLQRLATHRLIRIGIPLLVAGILLIPLMFGMAIAITRSPWRAAAEGDTAYVDAWIQSGQDLDRRLSADQPNKGSTMLHIAAELGSAPIVQKLCDAGADVNAPATIVFLDREVLSTPLHVAAKESNLDCVKILIAANADVNAIDAFDNSPLDYASSQEIKRVLRANGGVTVSEMSREDRENRQNVAREAVEAAGKSDAFRYRAYVMRQTPLFQLALTLSFFPPSFHLWFLYYLAVLTVLLIVIGALTQALGIPSPPNGLLRGPLFWLWATPLSMLMFFMMRQGFGPDTFT